MSESYYFDTPIFVTGMPRSGTSMVAGCLQLCGAWLGNTVAGGVGNPKGFFENYQLREQLIKPLLIQLGCDPLGVKALPNFKQVPNIKGLDQAFIQLLKKDGYTGESPWLYKDAKITLLWPLFSQAFSNARWVVVNRTVEDIIESCMNTHFMAHHSSDITFWQDFVQQYQQRLNALKHSGLQVFSVSADNLVSGNSDEILTLAETLGLTPNRDAVEQFVTPQYWRASRAQ